VRARSFLLHVFDWPADGTLTLPGITAGVKTARLLAGGPPLSASNSPAGVVVELPPDAPDPIASVVAVELEGDERF
jgi:alpha-L-fucosidase